jgi:glycosyltransferase involved in cell wall biosynthesis
VKVLILHSRYASGSVSGENRVVEDEARLLREAGHEVTSWTPQADEISPPRAGASAVWSRSARRNVSEIIDRDEPDVVHVHNLFPRLSPAVIPKAAQGRPVVMTLHNYRLLCLPATLLRDGKTCTDCVGRAPWAGVRHRCYRSSVLGSAALASSLTLHRALGSFHSVARFAAVSGYVRDAHVDAGLIDRARIEVKPNFAWPTQLRADVGEHFLYAGRLSAEKGVAELVTAWPSEAPPLVLAGGGPLAESIPTRPNVRTVGSLPPDQVAGLIRRAHAVLVPSRWAEGAPRIIVEAYAAGIPVIASAVGALPEFVLDGITGALLHSLSDGTLSETVGRLQEPSERTRMGDAAHALWREHYGPEAALASLEALYEAVAR